MKKLLLFIVISLSFQVQARLGQPEFNLEKEYGKKTKSEQREKTGSSYNGTIKFSNITINIEFRGMPYHPLNAKVKFYGSGGGVRLALFDYHYKSHKSVKETVVFNDDISVDTAKKYIKKLLPKGVKTNDFDISGFSVKHYKKKINISFKKSASELNDIKVTLIKSITVEYDKSQLDLEEKKKQEEIRGLMLRKAKSMSK
jgi:hypothetical protein